jgi:hypothetical protein
MTAELRHDEFELVARRIERIEELKTQGWLEEAEYRELRVLCLAQMKEVAGASRPSKASPSNPGDSQATMRADYQITVDVVKLLSDIRFRCLVFVTAIGS